MKKHVLRTFILVMLFAVMSGCGAGSDATFSPDPSIGDQPTQPSQPTPVDDGSTTIQTDCFEAGFCARVCSTASECPTGYSCVLRLCTFDCQTDAECGTGGKCNSQKLCEATSGDPMPLCTEDAECGDGRFCSEDGACNKIEVLLGCNRDSECPTGQYCDDAHLCQLYPGAGIDCATDADCLGEAYCDANNQCAQDCRTDLQCPEGQSCTADGKCVTPGAPTKLVSFTFNALGADTDPTGPVAFTSQNYVIDQAEIVPFGRSETSKSARFRLVGSAAQGILTDANGLHLTTTIPVEVRYYDSAIAGIDQGIDNSHVIYAEHYPTVAVSEGRFAISMGEGQALGGKYTALPREVFATKENVYLELWIDGERLSPRQRMGAMGAVFTAEHARYADTITNLPTLTETDIHNYSADIITAGTIAEDRIPASLDVSRITGTLKEDYIPSDLSVDLFDQTVPLPAALIKQIDAGKIVGGPLTKDRFDQARYVVKKDIAILSGSATDGQALNFPNGFTEKECVYMLTPGVTLGSVEGIDQIMLSVDSAGVVTCKFDEKNQLDGGGGGNHKIVSCTANYLAICKKGICRQGDRLLTTPCTP